MSLWGKGCAWWGNGTPTGPPKMCLGCGGARRGRPLGETHCREMSAGNAFPAKWLPRRRGPCEGPADLVHVAGDGEGDGVGRRRVGESVRMTTLVVAGDISRWSLLDPLPPPKESTQSCEGRETLLPGCGGHSRGRARGGPGGSDCGVIDAARVADQQLRRAHGGGAAGVVGRTGPQRRCPGL